jgi:Domain of unknown function (DUF6249)
MDINSGQLFGYIVAIIITMGALTAACIWVYFRLKAAILKQELRSKERLALIEKGITEPIVSENKRSDFLHPLLWGLLLVGMGAGMTVGYFIGLASKGNELIITNAMTFLFGGMGMIIYYWLQSKMDKSKSS